MKHDRDKNAISKPLLVRTRVVREKESYHKRKDWSRGNLPKKHQRHGKKSVYKSPVLHPSGVGTETTVRKRLQRF